MKSNEFTSKIRVISSIFFVVVCCQWAVAIGHGSGNEKEVVSKYLDKQANDISRSLPGINVSRNNQDFKVTLNTDGIFSESQLRDTKILLSIARSLAKYEYSNITIAGHTDSMGAGTYNMKLSSERAQSVMDFFMNQGIKEDRMDAVGFGENDPVMDNLTTVSRKANRRIEITVSVSDKMLKLAKKGKL